MSADARRNRSALLNVEQMASADRAAGARGISGPALMKNAGDAVAAEIARRWKPQPVLILCGPGNNGGDGFAAACALSRRNWPVRIALLGTRQALTGDARYHADQWSGPIESMAPGLTEGATLVVDAIFGAGLNRPLPAAALETLAEVAKRAIPVAAVDVPSGVMGNSGESLGAIQADCTITFARKKPAHVLYPGRALCGDISVADIGIPDDVIDSSQLNTWENHPCLWRDRLPHSSDSANKYSRGHAVLFGGYPMTGAAKMAARAAARAGAGLTTIGVPPEAFPVYAPALSSIMLKTLDGAADWDAFLTDGRISGLLIGPGAGTDEATRRTALSFLHTGRPVVLDADAITVFAGRSAELARAIRGPCVLTPHEGEFARLFTLSGDKLQRARTAANSLGAVVVLKGPDTVIAAPDGRAMINTNAPATLATAGSGDVLGGFILGLLTQGMDAFCAAAAGVWMHGAAAASFGAGLLAEDLPDLLPAVLRGLAGANSNDTRE